MYCSLYYIVHFYHCKYEIVQFCNKMCLQAVSNVHIETEGEIYTHVSKKGFDAGNWLRHQMEHINVIICSFEFDKNVFDAIIKGFCPLTKKNLHGNYSSVVAVQINCQMEVSLVQCEYVRIGGGKKDKSITFLGAISAEYSLKRGSNF